MKKILYITAFLLIFSSQSFADTIKIDLENLPSQAINNSRIENSTITSQIDATYLLAFVESWKSNDSRKTELLNLCSDITPKMFLQYPEAKELKFSAYVNYKDKYSRKEISEKVFEMAISREDAKKMSTGLAEESFQLTKYIKILEFKNF